MTTKLQLRKELKATLARLDQDIRQEKGAKASYLLLDHIKTIRSDLVNLNGALIGAFAPMSDEIPWINSQGLWDDFKMAFPRSNDYSMAFYKSRFEDLEEAGPDELKFLRPKGAMEVYPDIIICPGLGFSKNGHRLGRGKGFYDRFLANYTGTIIGICFEEQILSCEIPSEDHDVLMDTIITDQNIYQINQNYKLEGAI